MFSRLNKQYARGVPSAACLLRKFGYILFCPFPFLCLSLSALAANLPQYQAIPAHQLLLEAACRNCSCTCVPAAITIPTVSVSTGTASIIQPPQRPVPLDEAMKH